MSPQTYLVHMPRAEARYLAGVSVSWPATPEARCVHAVREWLNGIRGRRAEQVPVQKIIQDLDPLLRQVPPAERPQHGPLAGRGAGTPMSGCVEYLGGGIVRLDEDPSVPWPVLHRMTTSTSFAPTPGRSCRSVLTGISLTRSCRTPRHSRGGMSSPTRAVSPHHIPANPDASVLPVH